MMDRELLEQQLSELPLYIYTYIDRPLPVRWTPAKSTAASMKTAC